MEKFAETLVVLQNMLSNKEEDLKSGVTKQCKRRTKALKAKITKIKNADLAERLNISEKMILEQKISNSSLPKIVNGTIIQKIASCDCSDETEIVNAIKRTVLNLKTEEVKDDKAEERNHNIKDTNVCNLNCKYYVTRCLSDIESAPIVFYQKPDSSEQKYYTADMLDAAIDYLKKLLQQIISVYQNHWKNDLKKEQRENVSDLGNYHFY